MDVSVRFRVTGRVQGVAFRAWTRSTAESFGLAGWVRNADDGSVEGCLQGPEPDVERMITALHQGPGAASVRDVATEPVDPQRLNGFEIKS